MSIFIVTGACGAGKSTLARHLKSKLSSQQFRIYDFDENGVPHNADECWRKENTYYWLDIVSKNETKGITSIICGSIVPHEVLQIAESFRLAPHTFIFSIIKVEKKVLHHRLMKRGWDFHLIQNNITWADSLEYEVVTLKGKVLLSKVDGNESIFADMYIQEHLLNKI